MASTIEVRALTKIYGTGEAALRAVDRVDLDVHDGELVLLSGPSGSGKTTLLSIVGGILQATSGSARLKGHELVGLPQKALPRLRLDNIGFIFQAFNLFPTLTAAQNVTLALDLKGIRGRLARRRASELLDEVGLSSKLDTYPADMSGGQKQRVAIARALAGDPPIILADEPTAALDSTSGHLVMRILQRLAHDRGRAIVIVTHDARMVGYADRIVRMEDGRIRTDQASDLSVLELQGADV